MKLRFISPQRNEAYLGVENGAPLWPGMYTFQHSYPTSWYFYLRPLTPCTSGNLVGAQKMRKFSFLLSKAVMEERNFFFSFFPPHLQAWWVFQLMMACTGNELLDIDHLCRKQMCTRDTVNRDKKTSVLLPLGDMLSRFQRGKKKINIVRSGYVQE